MNVAEAAAKFKVSKQAVYAQLNKLSNKGKDSKTGQLTDEGIKLLESIYQAKEQAVNQVVQADLILVQAQMEQLKAEHADEVEGLQTEIKRLTDALAAVEKERDAFKQASEVQAVRFEAEHDKVTALTSERDFLREQLSKAITPKLPAPDQQEDGQPKQRKWFMRWLR